MLVVQELSDKVDRYVEFSEEAEDMLEGSAATALATATEEASARHISRLSQVKLIVMKKVPVKQEPVVRTGSAGASTGSTIGGGGGGQKMPVKIKLLTAQLGMGSSRHLQGLKRCGMRTSLLGMRILLST